VVVMPKAKKSPTMVKPQVTDRSGWAQRHSISGSQVLPDSTGFRHGFCTAFFPGVEPVPCKQEEERTMKKVTIRECPV
jgi:hypothetical protein